MEIEGFTQEFETAIGLSGAETWIGERLHEAVPAGRTTVERHLTGQYFSEFDIRSDTTHILVENNETVRTRVRFLKSRTDELNTQVKQCLEGDYTGLKTIERELAWKPGRGMKL